MPDDKTKKQATAPPDDWLDNFQGTVKYSKNGIAVVEPKNPKIPFDIVYKGDERKIISRDGDIEKMDFEKLPNLNRKDFDDNIYNLTLLNSWKYWGNSADVAKKQGWYPSVANKETQDVTFRAPYDAPFNTVQIPDDKKLGNVAIVGHPNGKFDVVVNHADGSLEHSIMQGINPDQVEKWITSPDNTIAQRVKGLKQKQVDAMTNEPVVINDVKAGSK